MHLLFGKVKTDFMNILSLENVSKNYGIKPLFENVTLGFEDTDKIGIIGANGSGKTTFLRVVAGDGNARHGKCRSRQRQNARLFRTKSAV